MKSIITQKEENKYYLRTNLLYPIYMAILFTVIMFIIYLILQLFIKDSNFNWSLAFKLIALLGFIEGLSTVYIMFRYNKKNYKYYSNLSKKSNADFFVPVTLVEGFMKNSHGTLVVTKNKVDFVINQLFEKRNYISEDFQNVNFEVVWEENCLFKKIITFTKGKNILYLTVDDKKYCFIIPSTINLTHRLETNPILGKKRG